MEECKINEHITLKLEGDITKIYIDDVLFLHCKYLLLEIPADDTESLETVDSIDEAADVLDKDKMQHFTPFFQQRKIHNIDPKTEFWGHCSNIQAWVENNYDTRLLHSNLSFPLLKKLTEVGDPVAKKYFKEEIARRYSSGYQPVKEYLLHAGYLHFLDENELESIGAPKRLGEITIFDNELSYLIPVQLIELDEVYQDIIKKILANRAYHTHEFYRIARITKFPSIIVADFSTIPGKYPSISDIYLRFIIAKKVDYHKLSNEHLHRIRLSKDLRYNLDKNTIHSEEFFVTLFDLMNFHLMDLWT
ncbi:MAG: hypothetical protein HWN66_11370 [Candidatus Helarchaeota archaeon]|nr:hypothetical protein [Candidatus Helarchaeota archaeon]